LEFPHPFKAISRHMFHRKVSRETLSRLFHRKVSRET